mgnify:CR=1 FL=1
MLHLTIEMNILFQLMKMEFIQIKQMLLYEM